MIYIFCNCCLKKSHCCAPIPRSTHNSLGERQKGMPNPDAQINFCIVPLLILLLVKALERVIKPLWYSSGSILANTSKHDSCP